MAIALVVAVVVIGVVFRGAGHRDPAGASMGRGWSGTGPATTAPAEETTGDPVLDAGLVTTADLRAYVPGAVLTDQAETEPPRLPCPGFPQPSRSTARRTWTITDSAGRNLGDLNVRISEETSPEAAGATLSAMDSVEYQACVDQERAHAPTGPTTAEKLDIALPLPGFAYRTATPCTCGGVPTVNVDYTMFMQRGQFRITASFSRFVLTEEYREAELQALQQLVPLVGTKAQNLPAS